MPETYTQNQARSSRCFSKITLLDQKSVYFVHKSINITLVSKRHSLYYWKSTAVFRKLWKWVMLQGSSDLLTPAASAPGEAAASVSFPEETVPPAGVRDRNRNPECHKYWRKLQKDCSRKKPIFSASDLSTSTRAATLTEPGNGHMLASVQQSPAEPRAISAVCNVQSSL